MASMDQNLQKIANTYDIIAREYSQAFSKEHDQKPMDQILLKRFYDEAGHKKPAWDFGCGPGQTTFHLTQLGMEISGLDLSEKILEEARIFHPNITFQQGNMLELSFNANSIGAIVAFYAICHFSKNQVEKAFSEIFRVLQQDGIFFFTYHIGKEKLNVNEFLGKSIEIEFQFFPTDFIVQSLNRVGFLIDEIIERDPYSGVEYDSRRAYVFARKPT